MSLDTKLSRYMIEAFARPGFESKHAKVKEFLASNEQAGKDLKPHSRARKRTARHIARHAEHMAHALRKHAHPDDHKCAVKCAHKALKGEALDHEEMKGALRAYKHTAGKSKHMGNAKLELGRHSVEASSEVTADAAGVALGGLALGTAGLIAGGAYVGHKMADYNRRRQAKFIAEEMHKKQAPAKPATPPKPATPHKAHASDNTDIGDLSDHEALKAFHGKLADDVLDMPIDSKLLAKHGEFC